MAADTFMCVLLYFVSALLSSIEVFAQLRSCSPGTFCPIDANCTSNTNLCTVVCPTETDHMQQGNHLTGNCERIPDGIDHWMDSTLYEVFILSNQSVNTPILNLSFISSEQFKTSNFTYQNLVTDITVTLIGSCPYFYFTNMLKEEVLFENYYDLYVPDYIEGVSLALAETVPPDDYEMEVTVTNGDIVLQRRDIIVHVRDVPTCTTGPETFVEFSSSNFTVSKLAGSLVVTLVSSRNIPSQSFIIGIIAEADNSSKFPATGGEDFIHGRYNATFTTGATTATTSIPIIAGGSDEDVKQFSLRLFIDGVAYQQCVFSGNVSTATVSVTPALTSLHFSPSYYTIGEGDGQLKLTLMFTDVAENNITVKVISRDGSATGGGIDYDSGPYTVIIPARETSVSFYVSITDDRMHEGDENFILVINSTSLSDELTHFSRAVVTILNDDGVSVRFNQSLQSVHESNGFTQNVLVLSSPSSVDITIHVSTNDGSARGDVDYDTGPFIAVFSAGETSASFNVTIIDDNMLERDEIFFLNIISPPTASKVMLDQNNQARITIINDDDVTVQFTTSRYSFSENNDPQRLCQYIPGISTPLPVLVLSNPASFMIIVWIMSSNITATGAGIDYGFAESALHKVPFGRGVIIAPVNVSINNDNILEANETFKLTIHRVSGNARRFVNFGTPGNATVTIIDNDFGNVNFEQSTYNVYEDSGPAQPVLILSNPSSTDLKIQVTRLNNQGTFASGGFDFASGPYTVIFPAGETRIGFNVTIIDDDTLERDENFTLTADLLALPGRITIGSSSHTTITILNDDSLTLKFNQSVYSVDEDEELVQPVLALSNPSSYHITVEVFSTDGTATGGGIDYDSGPYNVTFLPGNTIATFDIPVVYDKIEEDNENFTLSISSQLPPLILHDDVTQAIVILQNINSHSSSFAGLIAGFTIGIIAAIVLIIIIICCIIYLKQKKNNRSLNFTAAKGINLNPLDNQTYGKPVLDATNMCAIVNEWKKQLGVYVIDYNSLKIEETIAKGTFGVVYRGVYTRNNKTIEVAIKTLKDLLLSKSEEFIEECNIAKKFDHPNVLSLIGVSITPVEAIPLMIMPYMRQGDVRSFLRSKRGNTIAAENFPKGLSYYVLIQMCLDIAKGMEYLSVNRFIHRDLAARNCMLDQNMVVKVADFGLSRDIYVSDYYRLEHATPLPVKWLAPEAIFDGLFTINSDVWAFGITCWEIFSLGLQPYPSINTSEVGNYLKSGKVLDMPHLSSDEMYEIMKSCWSLTPKERPSFTSLVKSISQQLPALHQQVNKNPSYLPIQ